MKKILLSITICSLFISCSKSGGSDTNAIAGTAGNPRFNLQFTNPQNVDLDLHVLTPNGTEIYYSNPIGQGGQLDVDCQCAGCASGPNENIYWVNGTAPHGTYQFWAQYYQSCSGAPASSNFTLRILNMNTVIHTYTGTLSSGKSQIYTFTY